MAVVLPPPFLLLLNEVCYNGLSVVLVLWKYSVPRPVTKGDRLVELTPCSRCNSHALNNVNKNNDPEVRSL